MNDGIDFPNDATHHSVLNASNIRRRPIMLKSDLGKHYEDGEIIIQQGETGDSLYVILEGQVEVILLQEAGARRLAVLGEGDFFGEMEIFDASSARSASIRALGPARILTVDKKTLLKRLQEDPSLALHFLQSLSDRLRRSNRQELLSN
jgi:CRP/FNR family cyclic AMP-dependent transcriptional regulator